MISGVNLNDNYNNLNSIILIMAGGLGKRMNSDIPKVLHIINDKPMIIHIIETSLSINPFKIGIIVGKYYNLIYETIQKYIEKDILDKKIKFIIQEEPRGTGDAIKCCYNFLNKTNINISKVMILSGDVPLIKKKTINSLLLNTHECKILIANIDNSTGYGRILLNKNNKICKIIEEKDCNIEEKNIKLINSGIYCLNLQILLKYINNISNNNSQNEYYLTEIFELMANDNIYSDYLLCKDIREISGINTQEQLKELNEIVKN
jgi:UDP-N-acetylglucosamine diphosphorylase/glucosamine-1-phosphate N-acetyltransferase